MAATTVAEAAITEDGAHQVSSMSRLRRNHARKIDLNN